MPLRSLVIDLVGNIEKLQRDLNSVTKDIQKFSRGIEAVGRGLQAALGVGVTAVVGAAIKKINDLTISLAKAGEQAGSIQDAFSQLGGNTRQIEEAQRKVLGVVDAFDLMQIANKALVAGFPKLADNFGAVADAGARLADTLGLDTKQAVNDLSEAITKGNSKALAAYGISIDKTQSLEQRRNSALQQAIDLSQRLAPVTDSVTNASDALGVVIAEVTKNIGIQINQNPVLTQSLRDMGEAIKNVDWQRFASDLATVASVIVDSGTTVINWIEKIRQAIDDLNFADRVITQGGAANPEKFAQQIFDEQEAARLIKRIQDIRKAMAEPGGPPTEKLVKEWEVLWQQTNLLSEAARNGLVPAFNAVKEELKSHEPVAKRTVFNFASIEDSAGKAAKEYKELNIAQHVVSQQVRTQLTPTLQHLFDLTDGGANFTEQYIKTLNEMRDAFVAAGGSAQDFDSTLQSIQKRDIKAKELGKSRGDEMLDGIQDSFERAAGDLLLTLLSGQHFGEAEGKQLGAQLGRDIASELGLGPIGKALGAFGGEAIAGAIHDAFSGGGNADTEARKGVVNFIEETLKGFTLGFKDIEGQFREFTGNILLGDSGKFNTEGWADSFNQMDETARSTFSGLGEALEELVGVSEDVGSQIAFVLAENLSGSVDNARLLVQALGLDFEDLEAKMVEAGLRGEMTWHEVEVALQGLGEAFQPGLQATGDIAGAFEEILSSGGRGLLALKGLRDLAIEALQRGITNLDELRAELQASGLFSEEDIAAAFQALDQRGISSLEALAEVSDRVGGGIIADMQSLGVEFEDLAKNVQDVAEAIANIEDNVSKSMHFDISTSLDGNTVKAIDGGVFKAGGVSVDLPSKVSAFASGGIVNGPTMFGHSRGLGLMGEAGPEAILPLKRVRGKLGVSFDGLGGGGGATYYVDARGASPGVERTVMQALRSIEDRATRRALRSMSESINRGEFD